MQQAERAVMALAGALVALALVARLFAGPAFAEPRDGLVPICAGGQLVWISVEDPETAPVTDPCPWIGLAIAAEPAEPAVTLTAATPARIAHLEPVASSPLDRPRQRHLPRAPPGV